jgi:hypothetical protein
MKIYQRRGISGAAEVALFAALVLSAPAIAAQGEMGTGIPTFGTYSAATGAQTLVWTISESTAPFPAGCTSLTLSPATMGMDTYKIAVATLITAKTANRRVRFFAHAPRDGGCGVDYVEMQ